MLRLFSRLLRMYRPYKKDEYSTIINAIDAVVNIVLFVITIALYFIFTEEAQVEFWRMIGLSTSAETEISVFMRVLMLETYLIIGMLMISPIIALALLFFLPSNPKEKQQAKKPSVSKYFSSSKKLIQRNKELYEKPSDAIRDHIIKKHGFSQIKVEDIIYHMGYVAKVNVNGRIRYFKANRPLTNIKEMK